MKIGTTRIAVLLSLALNAAPAAAQPPSPQPFNERDKEVYVQIRLLNQVPQDQLSERADPGLSILKAMQSLDGPGYIVLRRLLSRADIRSALNPGAKAILADLLSDRWDSFSLAGNLWLGGLRSANSDLRLKARQKLMGFIQPAHLPVLIDLLSVPGPNVLAFEILQQVTGETLDPSVKAWKTWWAKTHGKVDLVNRLLQMTQGDITDHPLKLFEVDKLWYLPPDIRQSNIPYAKRKADDQVAVTRWNQWAHSDVKQFLEDWIVVKPALDRVINQPDTRVTVYLESLVKNPGLGDYASNVLAWRQKKMSLKIIQEAYAEAPTAGRALARGSLGDKSALTDLLKIVDAHPNPLAYGIMDQDVRSMAARLSTAGLIPPEQAFQFLVQQNFGFFDAANRKEKKKALRKAERWLKDKQDLLVLDLHRGCYVLPTTAK